MSDSIINNITNLDDEIHQHQSDQDHNHHNQVSITIDDEHVGKHCHVVTNDQEKNKQTLYKLITLLCLCVVFMIGEIIGGVIAGSIAIQTDAAHMASDIVAYFLSAMAIWISKREPTKRMSFGYFRSEILGAFFGILIIWVVTGVLVYLAIQRTIDPSLINIEGVPMVATATCGVAFNILMFFITSTHVCFKDKVKAKEPGLKEASVAAAAAAAVHTNDIPSVDQSIKNGIEMVDSGEKKKTKNKNKKNKPKKEEESNINMKAAAIHVIGDFIQSLGVLIAAVIIYCKPEYKLADPICTFIFSVLVMCTTAPIIKDIFFVLMEASPGNVDYDQVVKTLCDIKHVTKIHNLNIWCLTSDKIALAVHLVTEKNSDPQKIIKEANDLLRTKFKIDLITIQVEYFDASMNDCNQCKLPL
jgi:zinc transporter 2